MGWLSKVGGSLFNTGLSTVANLIGGKAQAKAQQKQLQQQQGFEAGQAGLSREEQAREFNASNALQTSQFEQNKALSEARKAAYQNMINAGSTQQQQGENQLMSETSNAPPELLQAEQDIQNRTAEGIQAGQNQMQANLAQQGVRGGQAATQLRRGVGEMAIGGMRDVNQMKADDAARRQSLRAAYLASKASQGGQAALANTNY